MHLKRKPVTLVSCPVKSRWGMEAEGLDLWGVWLGKGG